MIPNAPASSTGRRQQNAIACEECHARKLRCDMGEPQCTSCSNLNIPCIVNTARRPRGPRKGHVKILKARISTLERQLNEHTEAQMATTRNVEGGSVTAAQPVLDAEQSLNLDLDDRCIDGDSGVQCSLSLPEDNTNNYMEGQASGALTWSSSVPSVDLDSEWSKHIESLPDSAYFSPTLSLPGDTVPNSTSAWPMEVGMQPVELDPSSGMSALERADLDDLFFERAYVFAPILNQQQYYPRSARELDTGEPFACLQYAMRTVAASMCSRFKGVLPILYEHAHYEAVAIELVQARLLLAIYEILKTNPRKGWINASRCFHLVHLAKLDEIDNPKSWKASTLSWVEVDERRRTFWTAHALDRYANFVNCLPIILNDHMQAVKTEFLATAMDRINDQQLSSYAKSIVVVTILARCLSHNSQCKVEGIIHPSSEQSLVRHRTLDTILCQEVRVSTTATYSDMESCHLEYIFTKTLAQAAFLVLFTVLESVHPFTPIALFICADFLRSHKTLNQNNAAQFDTICASLRHLAPANNLVQMLEFELQRNTETFSHSSGHVPRHLT
ncbi:hypothetical protein BDW60DRAFT_220182 [Aspergillus nidulans var. acristatus]